MQKILIILSLIEVKGIFSGAIKCVDIERNTISESALLDYSDIERRRLGEQKGLDTLVVLAVNIGR